ncbi:MAG: ABC transporter substrate-binding protein [Vescimonas sp.]
MSPEPCVPAFVSFNEDNAALQDKNVRLALNYAANKKSVAEDLYDGNGLEAHGMYQDSVLLCDLRE